MRRILSTALVLVMLLSCAGRALAVSGYVYTYYDAAQTQIKSQAYYEDDVLMFIYEYPVAGDTATYVYSAYWDGDGILSYREEVTLDRATDIQTQIASYYDNGTLTERSLNKWRLDEDLGWVRIEYEYVGYYGLNGAVSRKETGKLDGTGLIWTAETQYFDYTTGMVSWKTIWVETSVLDEDGAWLGDRTDFKEYDAAGRLTYESVRGIDDRETYASYRYDRSDRLIEKKAGTIERDQDTGDTLETSVVTDGSGRKTAEETVETKHMYDDQDNYLGYSEKTETKFFSADGALIKTESAFREYDDEWSTLRRDTSVGNERGVTTSSVRYAAGFDELDRMTEESTKSSLFDGTSGKTVASIDISSGKEYDQDDGHLVRETRTSVNQDGRLIASYTFEDKGAEGSQGRYEYYSENPGKLRKSVDETAKPDGLGGTVRTTTVRNAAGIVTESGTIKEGLSGEDWIVQIENKRFDSVTGALKSTTVRKETYGEENLMESAVKNAAGVRISSENSRSYVNDKGWDAEETVSRRFDPLSGQLTGESKRVSEWFYDDALGANYSNSIIYDAAGRILNKDESGPLLDAQKKVIGDYWMSSSYDSSGNLWNQYRSESTPVKDAFGRQIGSRTIEKQDGVVTSISEFLRQYDSRGIYLGYTNTSTGYYPDGSVKNSQKTTYDADTWTSETVETNAKGKVFFSSKQTVDRVDGHEVGRTSEDKLYSEYTGNLMTTTTVKSKRESTGVFEERGNTLKANGQLAGESELSYMFVDGYGFMNYKNTYADYLYRADGSLKYTIQGRRLMDNFYLDLFAGENWYGEEYLASEKFTEELETKTTAAGILAQEHHLVNNYEQGLDSYEYSIETKVYDEKTGALQSVTTETQTYDPDLQKTVVYSRTVDAQGRLLGEVTDAWISDFEYVDLGRNESAFLSDGRQIKSYVTDGKGLDERVTRTYNAQTGGLLISSLEKFNPDGTGTTEKLTYDAAGNVIRRDVSNSSVGSGGAWTDTTESFNAAGVLISRDTRVNTPSADGSNTIRRDEVDALGRSTFYEAVYGVGSNGQSFLKSETSTYYDEEGLFRKSITEGNKTVLYDVNMKVLSVTVENEDGTSRTTDANGRLLYYSTLSDQGDLSEFFADGKPRLTVARDDDGEVRRTSYDKDGYINYVSIRQPDKPYTMYYDGNGKVSEIDYYDSTGRSAYYNAKDKQWYTDSGEGRVAIGTPDFAAGIDMSDIVTGGKARPRYTWYPNNTCCTFGIHLRDIMPELTGKWYTVTPIDLSRNGTQSFELIGSNIWIIGQVNVIVDGDSVLIDREIILDGVGNTKVHTEYLNVFSDINSITEEALEGDSLDGKGYKFGEPISIQKDLGGDTNVLLYVRNVATYSNRVYRERYLTRMWENLPERVERRNAMIDMMDPLVKEDVPAATGN